MRKRVYNTSFKRMAVAGSVKEIAVQLGTDPSRLSKWRNRGTCLRSLLRG